MPFIQLPCTVLLVFSHFFELVWRFFYVLYNTSLVLFLCWMGWMWLDWLDAALTNDQKRYFDDKNTVAVRLRTRQRFRWFEICAFTTSVRAKWPHQWVTRPSIAA